MLIFAAADVIFIDYYFAADIDTPCHFRLFRRHAIHAA